MTKPLTHVIAKIVTRYLQLRDQKRAIKEELAERTAVLNEEMVKLENVLQQYMQHVGLESLSTEHETVYTTTTYRASCTDWDAALEFIRQHEAWHLLTKKLSDVGVRELAEDGTVIPGTKLTGVIRINVRSK